MQLVLSLFPGIDLLGLAFKREGFCVVQGGDVIWGGDIREEHYPAGRFDGVIGGPPCQTFSRLAHMVRHNGYEPKFGNLIPEFERVIDETEPRWFIMENVPDAPMPVVDGYDVYGYILNNRQCVDEHGKPAETNRTRRFSWGWRDGNRPQLMIDVCAIESPRFKYAAVGGSQRPCPKNGHIVSYNRGMKLKKKTTMPFNTKSAAAAAQELCHKQGIEPTVLDHLPFTKEAKCKAIGNGVPLPMGRAIARAVKEAIESTAASSPPSQP